MAQTSNNTDMVAVLALVPWNHSSSCDLQASSLVFSSFYTANVITMYDENRVVSSLSAKSFLNERRPYRIAVKTIGAV